MENPPGDGEVLAEYIIKLALDPELGAKPGRANRAHVEKEVNAQKMCEEMVKLVGGESAKNLVRI